MRLKFLTTLWISLVMFPTAAIAQTAPEVTDEPFIAQAEILFPAAIMFTVNLEQPPEAIADTTLTITAGDSAPIIVEIQPQPAATDTLPVDATPEAAPIDTPTSTRLVYIWMIPEDNPPLLFSDVYALWEIMLTNGERLSLASLIVYQDERFTWDTHTRRDGRWTLTVPTTFPVDDIRSILADLDAAAGLFSRLLGQNLTYNVILYTEFESPGCEQQPDGSLTSTARRLGIDAQVPCSQTLVDTMYRRSGYLPLHRSDDTPIRQFLLTWQFDQVYQPLWAGTDVPLWFRFALLRFFLPESEAALVAPLVSAARADQLIPLGEMNTLPNDANLRRSWESQSYAMLVYLLDQVGRDGVLRLSTLRDGATFNEAYETVVGQSMNVLVRNVGRWLITDQAGRAFSITPYQPDTPTPPPTQPSTPTLTHTATTLPTDTHTAAPVTPTLAPSATPTRTNTPALPTNTPRPPGSLDTPMPTAIPATSITDVLTSSGGQAIIVSALILLLGAAIFAYIRLGRRS